MNTREIIDQGETQRQQKLLNSNERLNAKHKASKYNIRELYQKNCNGIAMQNRLYMR